MSFAQKFTRRDLGFAVLTGLITGTIAWQVFEYLKFPALHNIPWFLLVVVLPVLWILGVFLGYFLGQWLEFFNQFGKFVAIGFTNAAVTLGVLNLFLSQTGYTSGIGYTVISCIPFVAGVLSSYVWNKYWAFRSDRSPSTGSGSSSSVTEFGKFLMIAAISFVVNVTVASVVVNFIHPISGINAHTWANIGAVAGSAAALVFSFVGFKMAVFRK